MNAMQDMCFVGATNGSIYAIDLSVTAIAVTAANASFGYVNSRRGGEHVLLEHLMTHLKTFLML